MADRIRVAVFEPPVGNLGDCSMKLVVYEDGGVEMRAASGEAIVLAEPRSFPEKSMWHVPDDFEDDFRHDRYRYTSWFATYMGGRIARTDAPSLCPEARDE